MKNLLLTLLVCLTGTFCSAAEVIQLSDHFILTLPEKWILEDSNSASDEYEHTDNGGTLEYRRLLDIDDPTHDLNLLKTVLTEQVLFYLGKNSSGLEFQILNSNGLEILKHKFIFSKKGYGVREMNISYYFYSDEYLWAIDVRFPMDSPDSNDLESESELDNAIQNSYQI